MKAWIFNKEKIEIKDIDKPILLENEVLIKTKAISLNPVDYKITKGAFGLSTPRVIGIDVAGVIEEVGSNCNKELLKKRVIALVDIFTSGSFSEYVRVDKNIITEIPNEVTFEEASTIPCAGVTAYQAVKEKINIRKKQTVFITVGNGSVGKFAIQLAKLQGAKVIVSANSDIEKLKEIGADYIIDYKNEDIHDRVNEITNNKGVDYIVDMLSSDNISENVDLLRFNGSIVGITGIPETYPFEPFTKAAGLIEVALAAAYLDRDEDSLKEISIAASELLELVKEKKIKLDISNVIKFEEIDTYLNSFEDNSVKGKIVVKL